MKTKESLDVFKKYYLKEFTFFDGENDITFNIVGIDFENVVAFSSKYWTHVWVIIGSWNLSLFAG